MCFGCWGRLIRGFWSRYKFWSRCPYMTLSSKICYPINRGKPFFKLENDIGYKFHDYLVSVFINIEKSTPSDQ